MAGNGPKLRSLHVLCLVLLATWGALPVTWRVTAAPYPTVPGTKSKDPGAVFFQGDTALSWDHAELLEARKLHKKDLSDIPTFLSAPSVGHYLGLSPIEALHMPVPLHIVFVGFAADGNMHVNISVEQLQTWFGQLDHVLPHTRVELSELTCAEDGHCAGLVHGRMQQKAVTSYVHLNFSCNVVLTRRVDVAEAFERAIHAWSRPVDPAIEMGAQQVDAVKMEQFVDNFVAYLGLAQNGYTLVVINPTWHVSEPVYGYRLGMSQPELEVLIHNSGEKVLTLAGTHNAEEPSMPPPYSGTTWMDRGGNLDRSKVTKFAATDAVWNSEIWAAVVDTYLKEEEIYRKDLLKAVGQVPGAAAIAHAVRLLRRRDTAVASVLREELLNANQPIPGVFNKFRTMHPAEDCLVGNWVGHQRAVLVDLTAGGFDWGPALGGQGVVHRQSMPSVQDHFSVLHRLKQSHLVDSKTEADKTVEAQLSAHMHASKSASTNNAYQAFAMEMSVRQRRNAVAPGESPLPPDDHDENADWNRRYQETVLKAELDVYEQFALKNCIAEAENAPRRVCEDMRSSASRARTTLAKLSSAQAGTVDVWRDFNWDAFGPQINFEEESLDVADEAQRARDLFMGELSSVLSRALRHVIAPPTATWTNAAGFLHDTASPFAKEVQFDIYVITEASHKSAPRVGQQGFDVEAYKQEVTTLQLPTQTFTFRIHRVSMSDDLLLATAFAAAQRTSSQEIPSGQDMMQDQERLYVDTRALAHVLRQRFTPHEARRASSGPDTHDGRPRSRLRAGKGAKLEVPVFVFELDRDVAVLLDEHYNAKALEDMILVVKNAAREDEHPTGMMCGGALLARPLSPLREALSATLTHLGGVLPPHLGYNPLKKAVTHDWLWSVGAHPQSFTSVGSKFTDLQRDALARSYVLDALDSSVDVVNEGIRALRRVTPTQLVHKHLQKNKAAWVQLLGLWPLLLGQWRDIMAATWALDWGEATKHLLELEDASLRFMHLAQKLADVPLNGQCQGLVRPTTEPLVLPTLLASIAVAAGALIWMVWPAFWSRLRVSGRKKGSGYRN